MKGIWIKNYADAYTLPFSASRNNDRFPESQQAAATDLSGKWAVTFTEEESIAPEQQNAVGIFEQDGNKLSGTFLTPTGDYRYLDGHIDDNTLQLSAFDGEHAFFLFKAELTEKDQLQGIFRSGRSKSEKWTAQRDFTASLPDANSLIYLKEGYDRLEFNFPDPEGNTVSPI